MTAYKIVPVLLIVIIMLAVILTRTHKPEPGRIIETEEGVTLTLAGGWEGEVIEVEWLAYRRILKGREDFKWVFPAITSRDIPVDEVEHSRGYIKWRFKGVEGNFDSDVSPSSPDFPVPPGLWSMDQQQMMLLWSYDVPLPWPGVEGTEATTRMYEVCRGLGDTSAVWHTYVVTFNHGPNAYEFVMLIPMTESDESYMELFWSSIENVEIEIEG